MRQKRFSSFLYPKTILLLLVLLCSATNIDAQSEQSAPSWTSKEESRGDSNPPVASNTPNEPVPGVPSNPGLINPKFKPKCEYRLGEFDCKHFSDQYCKDFRPKRNCLHIVFCGFPGEPPCHAANLTRIRLPGGGYLYCVVEPQVNKIMEGTCWTTYDNTYDPEALKDSICKAYRSIGVSCPLPPLDPRLLEPFPNQNPDHPLIIAGELPADAYQCLRDEPIELPNSDIYSEGGLAEH